MRHTHFVKNRMIRITWMMNNNICIRGAYYNSGVSVNYSTMLKKYNVKSLTKIALWRWKGKHIIYVNNTNV